MAGGKGKWQIKFGSRSPWSDIARYQRCSQQDLPVGEDDDVDPALGASQTGGAGGVEAKMLFDEAKEVFDGEAPKIHAAQLAERNRDRARPKQPHRQFVAWRAIRLQKLNADHAAHQFRQPFEMQGMPGAQT